MSYPLTFQPVSKETKDYILSLDIERDARLLRERLNICREALDYFCASSSLLKAGVRAGLTLYDIAVMCCRNDNLGEDPSKLEMLFSMASELAESAIENGRWHHAAASRALEEQLSPRGGSLFAQSPSNAVHKTMSAVNLSRYSEEFSLLSARATKGNVPGMVQSSASDSSSDNGEVDEDDCEEWAANLISDVSIERSMPVTGKKTRSISIESDSSNESDGEGFWYTNPGASPDFSDEESVNWSPANSPVESNFLELSASNSFRRNSFNPFSTARRASIILANDDVNESFKHFRSTPSKVTFAEEPPTNHVHEDRGLADHPLFKHSNSDVGHSEVPHMARPESTMRRSQSYSALSSTLADKLATEDEDPTKAHRSIDPEHYREYFLKFIDLVIVRETTAASQLKSET